MSLFSGLLHHQPQLGDPLPDLTVPTTQGLLNLHDWAEGRWTVLFGHPAPFTSVCTSELAALAAHEEAFAERGASLLGLCAGSVEEQRSWHGDVRELHGVEVGFPIIADEDNALAACLGMIHPRQSRDLPVRKTFVVGPNLRIQLIQEYPLPVGRSVGELLRIIDALQTVDRFDVAVGADWQKGDGVFLLSEDDVAPRSDRAQAVQELRPYYRVASDPWRMAA